MSGNGSPVPHEHYIGLGLAWASHVLEFVTSNPGVLAAYTSWAARQPDRGPDERPLTRGNLQGAEIVTTAMSCWYLADTPQEREAARTALRLAEGRRP